MDFHQLEMFTAVVETGSFSRAGERMFFSQPTVTMQVKALEDELAQQLLERSSQGVRVTAAGQRVYDYASSVLRERESLLATAEGEGLSRREALFARKPAAVTQEERRAAIAALLRIGEDSLTPEAINDTLTGCGIRARAEEKPEGGLRVVFPKNPGIPAEFDQIQKIILDILPCHLDVEFYFRYLTWSECEAAKYTWEQLEDTEHTWESFQLAVPPEE